MRWGMLPGSLIISKYPITQLWIPSNLGYSVILWHSRPSTAQWRSLRSRPVYTSLTGLDMDMSWQMLGHVLRLSLATLNVLKEVSTHLFAKPLCSYNCPFVCSIGSSHSADPQAEKFTVTVIEGAAAAYICPRNLSPHFLSVVYKNIKNTRDQCSIQRHDPPMTFSENTKPSHTDKIPVPRIGMKTNTKYGNSTLVALDICDTPLCFE